MSRSIHTTRRNLEAVAKQAAGKGAGEGDIAVALRKTTEQLAAKAAHQAAGTGRETVHATAIRGGAGFHHPHHSSRRRSLRAPCGFTSRHPLGSGGTPQRGYRGNCRIQLNLGKDYMEGRLKDNDPERDPFTRRPSYEVFPGVFGGDVLGPISPDEALSLFTLTSTILCACRFPVLFARFTCASTRFKPSSMRLPITTTKPTG